jgi:NitT/TauT family transport system substrate-binding protein
MQSSSAWPVRAARAAREVSVASRAPDRGVTSAGLSRRGLLTAGALAAITAAAGCDTWNAPAASVRDLEKPDLRVGAVQSVTAAGLYLAAEKGFFASRGLQVSVEPIQTGGKAVPLLLNGSLDIGYGNYVAFLEAQAHRLAQLRILAEGCVAGPGEEVVLIMPGSGIRTVLDLRGKLMGVNATGDVSQLLIGSVLASNQLPLSAVRFAVIPFPEMAAALKEGRVDAGYFTEPFKTEAESRYGAEVLFDTDQGATANFPITGAVTTAAWAQKYPKTAAAFIGGLEQGNALADSSNADVEEVLPVYTTINRQTAALISTGSFPTSTSAVRLQRIADDLKTFGMLTHPLNVTTMLAS